MYRTLIFLFFTQLFTSLSIAQTPFFKTANHFLPLNSTNINSMDVESADVDNDGDLDLIIAAEYSRNLLFFNDGKGNFAEDPTKRFPERNSNDRFSGEDSEDIGLADFDLDGDIDIIFVSEDTRYHELLLNDGTGKFTHIKYDLLASNGNAVCVLDLNNDSFPDIIIGNTGQNHVYINNGDLTFTLDNQRWTINAEGTQDLKLVDLDRDGDLDIIEGIDLGTNNILINDNGHFIEENDRLPTISDRVETRKITLGDINGDGYLDVFASTVNFVGNANPHNRMYINDGNGYFSEITNQSIPSQDQMTLDAIFIDYDLDGDLDLVTADFSNSSADYHVYNNDGQGKFMDETSNVFPVFGLTNSITVYAADFNNDGYKDIYFGNFRETDDLLLYAPDTTSSTTKKQYFSEADIFPNPAESIIQIFSENKKWPDGSQIIVSSLNGQIVLNHTLNTASKLIEMDIQEWNSGSYNVLIRHDGKELLNQMIQISK